MLNRHWSPGDFQEVEHLRHRHPHRGHRSTRDSAGGAALGREQYAAAAETDEAWWLWDDMGEISISMGEMDRSPKKKQGEIYIYMVSGGIRKGLALGGVH